MISHDSIYIHWPSLVSLFAHCLTDTKPLAKKLMALLLTLLNDSEMRMIKILGPVSISEKTSYRKISWSLEVARFVFKIVRSLCNLTDTSAAVLPMCLSNFKAIRQFKVPISWLRDFTRSYEKTSFRILRRGPVYVIIENVIVEMFIYLLYLECISSNGLHHSPLYNNHSNRWNQSRQQIRLMSW